MQAAHHRASAGPADGTAPTTRASGRTVHPLLANCRSRSLPWLTVRLFFGTLLRMLGFLVVRSVGRRWTTWPHLLNLYAHPARSGPHAASGGPPGLGRRRTDGRRPVPDLLAPWWLPHRHGLDFLGDLVAAATNQAQDVAERRRIAAAEHAPASTVTRPRPRTTSFVEDTGLVARFLTNPIALALTVLVVVALVGARWRADSTAGGALARPTDLSAWWRLQVETWHPLHRHRGPRAAVPAALALLATLPGGSPRAAVSAVLLLAVPLPLGCLAVPARRRPPGHPVRRVAVGAAVGCVDVGGRPGRHRGLGDGRLGVVVVAALLPWLAHAALGFADPDADRRWRRGLAVRPAAGPGLGVRPGALALLPVALGLVVVAAAFAVVRGVMRDRSVWGPPAVAVGLTPLLLAPWWVPAVQRGAGAALLLDIGRLPAPTTDRVGLVAGRLGDLGAPWWLDVVLAVLAVLALVPRATRIPVLVLGGGAGRRRAGGPAEPGVVRPRRGDGRRRSGALVVVLQGAFVVAASLGAVGAAHGLRSWRRVVAAVVGRGRRRTSRRTGVVADRVGQHHRGRHRDRHPGLHGAELEEAPSTGSWSCGAASTRADHSVRRRRDHDRRGRGRGPDRRGHRLHLDRASARVAADARSSTSSRAGHRVRRAPVARGRRRRCGARRRCRPGADQRRPHHLAWQVNHQLDGTSLEGPTSAARRAPGRLRGGDPGGPVQACPPPTGGGRHEPGHAPPGRRSRRDGDPTSRP